MMSTPSSSHSILGEIYLTIDIPTFTTTRVRMTTKAAVSELSSSTRAACSASLKRRSYTKSNGVNSDSERLPERRKISIITA